MPCRPPTSRERSRRLPNWWLRRCCTISGIWSRMCPTTSRTGRPMRTTRRWGLGGWRSVFRPEVAEAVRLHVPAKRYLCATDHNYVAMLSQASDRDAAICRADRCRRTSCYNSKQNDIPCRSRAGAALGRSGQGGRVEDTRAWTSIVELIEKLALRRKGMDEALPCWHAPSAPAAAAAICRPSISSTSPAGVSPGISWSSEAPSSTQPF